MEETSLVKKDHYTISDLQTMAVAFAKSNLFGIKTPEQALSLILIAQAEGRHPALAALDYNIIQGKPSKSAKAIQRDFLSAGGSIEWHRSDDEVCDATFSHPQGGTLRVKWDLERAKKAGLLGKANWDKYTAAMLRARCVSEGCDAVCPGQAALYPPEIIQDFSDDENGEVVEVIASPAPSTKEVAKASPPIPPSDLGHDGIKTILRVSLKKLASLKPEWTEEQHFQHVMNNQNVKLEHIQKAHTKEQMEKLILALANVEHEIDELELIKEE